MPYFALCPQPIVYLRINKSKNKVIPMTARVFLAVKNKTFQHHFPLSDYRKGAIWEISKKNKKKVTTNF